MQRFLEFIWFGALRQSRNATCDFEQLLQLDREKHLKSKDTKPDIQDGVSESARNADDQQQTMFRHDQADDRDVTDICN